MADCSKPGSGIRFGNGRITGQMTLGSLVGSLSGATGRVVIDETRLADRFEIDLHWNAGNNPDSDQPSVFAGVQEQLGLRLESTHAIVDVLAIDHIAPPTEN